MVAKYSVMKDASGVVNETVSFTNILVSGEPLSGYISDLLTNYATTGDLSGYITDAPTGSLIYGRSNNEWVEISGLMAEPVSATSGDMMFYHNEEWTTLSRPALTGVAYGIQWDENWIPSFVQVSAL